MEHRPSVPQSQQRTMVAHAGRNFCRTCHHCRFPIGILSHDRNRISLFVHESHNTSKGERAGQETGTSEAMQVIVLVHPSE